MTMTLEDALVYTAEAMGATLSAQAIEMMVSDLAGFPQDEVLAALSRCRRERRGRLALADILERISSYQANKPPSAEEAWAQALEAKLWDEDATVVAPNCILRAFPFSVWPDRVAARMAFKDAYEREKEKPDAWDSYVSDGFDKECRVAATAEAINAGLLPKEVSEGLLPGPDSEPTVEGEEMARRLGALAEKLRRPPGDRNELDPLVAPPTGEFRAPPPTMKEIAAQVETEASQRHHGKETA